MTELETITSFATRLRAGVSDIVHGMDEVTRLCLVAVLTRGHVLLEGPPGTGKTLFAQTFARLIGLEMKRLQCTPDLLPGDVLGANVFDFKTQSFHLVQGPIFTECLLADEVNRTPPKTQSALLEAMQERAVTIDGTTHPLSPHFFVVATQNPIEHEGTYPLPEAQLDRFLFKIQIDYPDSEAETKAVLQHSGSSEMPNLDALGLHPLIDGAELQQLAAAASSVRVDPRIAEYSVRLAEATRRHGGLRLGLSTRAATVLVAAARAHAALESRSFVIPDDLKALFISACAHRVLPTASAEMEGVGSSALLSEILSKVPAPR
ncbi:MAG: MoxR family ATPase [Myxococcota bacterium]